MAAARRVMAVGHRGAPYRARENTLRSFAEAVRAGADAVELDVRLTRDGVPVVLHDRTLRRLWGECRPLSALTAREVRAVTAGGVPTFAEALRALRGVHTVVDLPDPVAAGAAARTVAECGARDRVRYCGDPPAMRELRAADPAAPVALTWKRAAPPRASLLADVRPVWLNLRFGLVDADLVRRTREAGLGVTVWTVDAPRTMRALVAAGVEAVTSNRVGTLRAVLDRACGQAPYRWPGQYR
jgi:glycerophosphoryl diester phosphodiesterase